MFLHWVIRMMIVIKLTLFFNFLLLTLAAEDQVNCAKNRTILETSGDAILSVFVDIHGGPYCNISSIKGLEELSTVLYVVHMLNKYDYVPSISLGLKIFDTCHDEMTVYRQTLHTAVESDCVDQYDLGVLVPSSYSSILEPISNYSVVPITTYTQQNLSKPLINAMVHYLSTRFEIIDLLLVSSDFALNYFLDTTKETGICVRSYGDITEVNEKNAEAVIAVIGDKEDIREWIETGEKLEGPRKTWVVLPLDGSNVDDLIPPGSYVMKAESFEFDIIQGFPSVENFLEIATNSVIHSPHLLGIGKIVIELAQVLQDIQKRNCPRGISCVLPRFNPNVRHEMRNSEVYDTLRILPKSHLIKYLIAMKNQHELVDVAVYKVESNKFRVSPEKRVPKMPRLCLKKYANNCDHCANFEKKFGTRTIGRQILDKGLLKSGNWTPIFLTVVVCGTVASGVIGIFIIYRFFMEDMLDGNPALTLILILANIFTLQTVLPFCMDDEFLGPENLNSRKIFVTTLAFGMIFSVMLSRAVFLAFSKGGIFTTHINGYLQGLMVFFMSGVQIAISTMYFILSTDESSNVVRSVTFIALLGYDIFLLTTLFVVCFFIAQMQRNYHEGKCFFGTAIGLSIAWAIWVTCFILMEPESRDIVVCFGIISTAYLIIAGILIPRTYYMVTHLARGREFGRRFDSTDLAPDPRMNTMARQARPFYDYVHPTGGESMSNLQVTTSYPNYYGSSSPNQKYFTRSRSPESRRKPGYNNYGFNSEMREVNNSYFVPDVCIEDADSAMERSNVDSAYAKPRCPRRKKLILEEKNCIETDVYVEGSLPRNRRSHDEKYPSRSPSPRLTHTEVTIREEDEDEDITRITRF